MVKDRVGPARGGIARRIVAAAVMGLLVAGMARPPLPRPSLFGVPLQTATRGALTRALSRAHLTLVPGGRHQWYDLYNVNGALKHASRLAVSYTHGGRFAKAVYIFPSFISTKRFGYVLKIVRAKYGPPSHMTGEADIGRVRARWKLADGFEIIVKRGWPNPTTYMVIENHLTLQRMKAEQRKAMANSGAF
ncbi:hypothetical protein [Acidiferrobacter sp.]|uniref:hypothetical protein n=1 Tax=Acidiferrobacter sp. TaxID=1872107 RepID=UPI00261DF3C5|nr:hypothetical protein [Acidiferrobacter sp.]